MKILPILTLILVTGITFGQKINLTEDNAPFKTVYNGNLDSIRTLGIESGDYKVYFDATMTQLKAEYTIKNDKIEGKYMEWYPDGQIHKDIEFKEGLFHGIHKESLILDGQYLTNISRWINGARDKDIQMEW